MCNNHLFPNNKLGNRWSFVKTLKTVSPIVAILFLAALPTKTLADLDCPVTETVVLDWSVEDWPDPVNPPGNNNYDPTLSHTITDIGGVDFTFTFTSDTNNANFLRSMESAADIVPAVASINEVADIIGPGGGEEGLSVTVNPMDVNGNLIDMDITMTLTLSEPIDEVEFTMSDIDGSGTRQDQMTVTGFNGAVPVAPVLSYTTTAAASVYTIVGNVATANGTTNVDTASGTAPNGTVIVNFSQPIDQLVVVYADANEGPGAVGGLRGTTMGNSFKVCKNSDLTISKNDNVTDAQVGDSLTYAITVTNNGPNESDTGVTIADTLPAGVTVNNGAAGVLSLAGADSSDWSCASNFASPQVINCSFVGGAPGLPDASSSTFNFVTDPLPASVFQSTLTNSVTVSGDPDRPDQDPTNNTGTHDTPITGSLLTLEKIIDNTAGGTATLADFVLTATGPETISGVNGAPAVTAHPVQAGTYVLSETTVSDYTAGAWSCVGVTAQSGARIRVLEGDNGVCTITNTYDPPPEVDLVIVKSVSDNEPLVGDTVTFTLMVANNGPDNGTNVEVLDIVPAGFTYVAGSMTGGNARDESSPNGTGLKWTINNLPSGSAPIGLTFQAVVLTP